MVKNQSRSDLNKDLLGVSVGNFLSSMLGGLPMISEIVRSKANVDANARSHRSNFFHGLFILLFVVAVPGLLKMIPMAALAAMLILTGSRLASLKEFLHVRSIGMDQFFLFLSTFLITIFTDLLIGVASGLMLKIIFHIIRGSTFKSLFGVEIEKEVRNGHIVLKIKGDAAFPSLLKLNNAVNLLSPEELKTMVIDLSDASLIDHTFLNGLQTIIKDYVNPRDAIIGIEGFKSLSAHPEATHISIRRT
jgi:MFS superfamily sulfate permease-like transporter